MAGTTLDTIVVEFGAQWTGGGVINRLLTDLSRVARGIKEVYDPSAMAGLAVGTSTQAAKFRDVGAAALTYKAQIAQVNKEMGQLGQALAGFSTSRDTNPFHGTAAEDAGRKYGELATRLDTARTGYDNLTKSASESTTAIGRFVTNLAPIAVKAGLATAAIVMLAKGVRFLYNQAAEGAAIRQTALSFDRVTQSMGNYTDLLDRLRAASKGTISDFEMMSSYLTLVAGASPELAANITAATPKLLEIAKAANVLNPALGDTTYFFESLAKGIKRSEVRWVDNLGIIVKVGEANKKYAEQLGKSVSDLTAMEKQQAYLNEVLRVGEGLIAQAGGSADSLTDSYTRLSASTANLGDSFKILMSIIAQDSVDEFSKNVVVIDNFFKEIISGILGVEEAENKRRDSANVGGFWAEFATGFIKDIPKAASGVRELALSFNLLMGGMRVYTDLSRYMDRGGGFFDFFKGEKLLSAPFEKIVAPDAGLSAFPSILEDVNGELALTEEAANRVAEAIKKWGPAADSADQAMFTVVENYQTGDRQSAYMDFVYGKRMAQYKELTAELNAANRSFNAEVMAAWREIETARTKNTASAWMGIFSGGDISSDLVVGNIKNIGSAWITVGGATTEQKERVAELRKEMEKAKEKLWDLNNGIGVQGDNAEKTAKKIEELNAEIANYGAVIAQLESDMPTGTRKKVDLGLDLDDIAVYKQFVEILGGVGASAQQLGQVGVAFGLIDPKVANAMEKVATLDTWLKDLALGVQVGDITIENSKEAADRIIAMLQSDLSMAEIKVKIRADLGEAKSQIMQDFRTDRKDPAFQGDLDVNANLDPALAAVAQATGVIQGTANKMTVDANIEPARKKLSDLVSEIEGKRVELVIQGIYRPPKNMPDSTSVEVNPGGSGGGNPGGGPGPYQQYGGGGYVRGGKGNPMAAIVHAGEYVLRPEAVEKLGVGFLDELNRGMGSSSNSVSVQNNFYGKVDTEQARTVIIQSARDAGDALADALLKTGYRI
mgnify:FL=1